MKLTIEIELQPEEIPLAKELFALLHRISNTNVKPKNTDQLFHTLISALSEQSKIDSSSSDINTLFSDVGQSCFDEFFNAFNEIVFDQPKVVDHSVVPYFYMITRYRSTM